MVWSPGGIWQSLGTILITYIDSKKPEMLLNILQCTRCLPGKDVLFLPRVTPLIPLFQPLPKENYLAEIVHKTASEKIWSGECGSAWPTERKPVCLSLCYYSFYSMYVFLSLSSKSASILSLVVCMQWQVNHELFSFYIMCAYYLKGKQLEKNLDLNFFSCYMC